jgi:hypothetical protein
MKKYPAKELLDQMPSMGRNGWIKMQFNRTYDNPFIESDMDAYMVPTAPGTLKSITQVSDEVAQDIAGSYSNLYVGMSGGIDSEWIASTFHRNGIPFTPIIYEAEDMMSFDTWWSRKWCADNGYQPVILKESVFQFTRGIIDISRQHMLRTPGGPYMMSRILQYVNDQGGKFVTGAGFPELFPDPNLSYMASRFLDNKLVNPDGTVKNTGWLLHESDFTLSRILAGHPWNFLSWTPEIVLAYISLRVEGTSEFNKAEIFNCLPRPKAIGIPDVFWRTKSPQLESWLRIKNRVGASEVDFLGSTDELKTLLTTGDINAV